MAEKHHTDWNRARARLSAAKMPALLLVLFVGFFWKLTLTKQYTWLDSPDIANQVLPWFQFQAAEWHRGHVPLWDPNLWGGQPLVGQAQPGVVYPPNWLLFLAPLGNGRIRESSLNWYFVLIHFQAALFCYWLCRDLKRTRAASLLSGIAFGLGGFVGTNTWPQMLNGAVWAPLVLLFFLRAMRGERPFGSAAWSGGLLGMAFLSGHHQIPIYISLAMGGAWLYYLLSDQSLRGLRLKLLFTFGLFLVLVSSLQVLPAYEYGRLSLRWVGAESPLAWNDRVPYAIHEQYALYPETLLGIVIPGVFRHSNPFDGLVALTLALLGVIACWEDRVVRLFGGIALGGLLFSLGHNSVFHGVIYAVIPMVEKARSPSMAIFIFNFGLCVLIAYGIDNYKSVDVTWTRRTARILCGFAAAVGFLFLALLVMKAPVDQRLGIAALAGILLAAILTAWKSGRIPSNGAIFSLAALMLFELGNVTTYEYQLRAKPESLLKNLSANDDIAEFLRGQANPVRIEVNQPDVPYNFGDWYGIDQFGGYLASLTENLNRVQANAVARTIYGVNYEVSKKSRMPGRERAFEGHNGLDVYSIPGAMPRAWAVHEVRTIDRDDQIDTRLEEPGFDPHRQTFIKGIAPQLEKCEGPESVSMPERRAGRVTLDANLKCRGMVIEADTFFPGWVATVDGKPAPIYEAYGFVRGVVVGPGQHRVQMRYRPKSVYWGAALAALGLLGACVLTRLKW